MSDDDDSDINVKKGRSIEQGEKDVLKRLTVAEDLRNSIDHGFKVYCENSLAFMCTFKGSVLYLNG